MKHGLAGNQGTRQAYHTGNLSQSEVRNASANNNFYANIGVNAGYSTSKNSNNSYNESAVVTTMKPMNENSSITYNNVNNITYQGTQAQGGTFIYNNVKNIRKEAVELHNSSSSRSSNFGISTGATIGYGYGTQITGNGGSVSANRSNLNTTETIYQNGNFQNVNEVHNNTGTMTLSGFNQEGGKVTGNIGKLVVESRQNTSTTTGSSSGMSLGISANGVPSSLNVNGSRTNGSRAFVDNQSSFIVGEGSNLHVGTVENTGAIIGKQSENGTTFKADKYVGHDIQNYDTMTTTGISLGTSLGKSPKVTNIGFNQDDRDKQGITRNTVVGNVEIGKASGNPINRDVTKANEVTKDVQHSTNINVESQTIEYATNPGKLKEDLNKAKDEIKDVTKALDNSIHDPGDDNRNFFGQLRETRLSETVNNIAGERLKRADNSEDVVSAWKDAYKDLGYNLDVKYTTGEDTPEMKNKAGTAYVSKDGVHTILININAEKNSTKAGLIGTLAEEASHIVNGVAGRQIATGTEEKGLESTGRAANAYFQEEYKGSNQNMTYKSDGKIDTSKLGTNVGDDALVIEGEVGLSAQFSKLYLNGKITVVRSPYKQKNLKGKYAKYNGKYVIWVYIDGEIGAKFDPAIFNAGASLSGTYFPGALSKQDTEIAKNIRSSNTVDFIFNTLTGIDANLYKLEDDVKGNDRFSGYGISKDFGFVGKSNVSLSSFFDKIKIKNSNKSLTQILFLGEVMRQIENTISNSTRDASASVGTGTVIPIVVNEGVAEFFNPSNSWIHKPKNKDYRHKKGK